MTKMKWWQKAIIYQIYPRSFQDSNGDGIGDIKGALKHLDYIQSLGVNTLWVNPNMLSPQEDNGYDVSDYYAIDPLFGTKEQSEKFVKEVHDRGMKLIYDFPLNHTSTEHYWFKEAIKGPDNPYRDYYIWADAPDGRDYPNNWYSDDKEPSWTKEPNGNQFYLHLYKDSMADLNWANPSVRKELLDIGKFWIQNGIDGFRLDAVLYIDKKEGLPDDPDAPEDGEGSGKLVNEHGPNIRKYLEEFNEELRKHNEDLLVIGEAPTAGADLALDYIGSENDMIDNVISFTYFPEIDDDKDSELPYDIQIGPLDKGKFKNEMNAWQIKMADRGGPILYWNNHDMPRAVSRFGDTEDYRDNSSKLLATLMYLQKGVPIIYYGEEIGMKNSPIDDLSGFEVPGKEKVVEEAKQKGYSVNTIKRQLKARAKNISRGVMQWDDTEFAGFSTVKPWIEWNTEEKYNVQSQDSDPGSILNYYRKLLSLKKDFLFVEGTFELKPTKETLYIYERTLGAEKALIYCNFSNKAENLEVSEDLQKEWAVILENQGNHLKGTHLQLAPFGAVVFRKQLIE